MNLTLNNILINLGIKDYNYIFDNKYFDVLKIARITDNYNLLYKYVDKDIFKQYVCFIYKLYEENELSQLCGIKGFENSLAFDENGNPNYSICLLDIQGNGFYDNTTKSIDSNEVKDDNVKLGLTGVSCN